MLAHGYTFSTWEAEVLETFKVEAIMVTDDLLHRKALFQKEENLNPESYTLLN